MAKEEKIRKRVEDSRKGSKKINERGGKDENGEGLRRKSQGEGR